MPKERIETDRFVLHRETDDNGAIVSSEFEMPDGTRLSHRDYVAAEQAGIPPAWYADERQPFAQRRAPYQRLRRLEIAVLAIAAGLILQFLIFLSLWRS